MYCLQLTIVGPAMSARNSKTVDDLHILVTSVQRSLEASDNILSLGVSVLPISKQLDRLHPQSLAVGPLSPQYPSYRSGLPL
jgi:hypothetical protein